MTYIFDMDGTLIDSMPVFSKAIASFLDDIGVAYPDDLIKTVTPLGSRGTASYFIESLGVKGFTEEDIIASLGERMKKEYVESIPAKLYVKEKLCELKKAGHSLAVLTASPHLTLDPCLKRLGLYHLFKFVWSCDDFGKTKSDPRIYREAAYMLGTSPSGIIFVDDNIEAVKTAKAAGLHAYGVYDASSMEYEEEFRRVAERYIMNFSEL